MRSAEPMLVPPNFITNKLLTPLLVILSVGSAVTHQLQHGFLDLERRKMGSVQVFRVGSLGERGFGAAAVPMIAHSKVASHILYRSAKFRGPPVRALLRLRIEED